MDERHKTILRKNRINVLRDLDPSVLYDGLLEKGVFTPDMIDEIKICTTRRDQARKLIQDLETRGSRAFLYFLECLRETGQHILAELLQNGESSVQPRHEPQIHVVHPVDQLSPVSLPKDVDKHRKAVSPVYPIQKSTTTQSSSPEKQQTKMVSKERTRSDSIQSYKMDANPCGHCLIINNVKFEPQSELTNRTGSNIDCDKLERRFKALNFIVEVKTNLKYKQIKHELYALSKRDHSLYDCCVVIILSHGTEVSHNRFPGAVHGVDGPIVPVQLITNYLNGQHCLSLQGKPKLFFIQACGGGDRDTGFEVSPDEAKPSIGGVNDETDAIPMSSSSDSLSTSDETDARATLPIPCDILVSYSTSPGYVSWRDTQSGSWYIETLDRILEENASTYDLVTMLTMVNNEVSQNSAKGIYKQMPSSFNSLRKSLYFQT